jgi:hypothetical protein
MIIGEDCVHSLPYPNWCDIGRCAPIDCVACPHYASVHAAYPQAIKYPEVPPTPVIYAHLRGN